jgi:two-component system LytT family response regulator
MAEWRVLIADDEPAARRGVRQLLSAHASFAVVGECRNGSEVLQALDTARPDVVFLDIQMPGLGGFDVIRRRTPARMPIVVFLTAYDEHALKAFEAEALDYLVKPVSQSRFDAAIRRVTRSLKGERAARAGAGSGAAEPRLIVSTPRGATIVPAREIDWIEAADNYARIWTGNRSYLLRESMSDLEQRIGPSGFARAHRRALVRVDRVRTLITSPEGDLTAELATGAKVPVSRRRRPGFVAAVEAAARRGAK